MEKLGRPENLKPYITELVATGKLVRGQVYTREELTNILGVNVRSEIPDYVSKIIMLEMLPDDKIRYKGQIPGKN